MIIYIIHKCLDSDSLGDNHVQVLETVILVLFGRELRIENVINKEECKTVDFIHPEKLNIKKL